MIEIASLQQGLMILIGTAFPRRCGKCGMVYKSYDEFITKTKIVPRQSALKVISDEHSNPAIELNNRSCICGSQTLELIQERRSQTAKGRERRKVFGHLLEALVARGWSELDARAALLKTMNGEKSERLVALLKSDLLEDVDS